jgi:hypothetical protein
MFIQPYQREELSFAWCYRVYFRFQTYLKPDESVSACAGKIKGRISKWLREQLHLAEPRKLLSRGYFACTTGKPSAEAVDQYLEQQGEHHGYASRPHPPLFVQTYAITSDDQQRLSTPGSCPRGGTFSSERFAGQADSRLDEHRPGTLLEGIRAFGGTCGNRTALATWHVSRLVRRLGVTEDRCLHPSLGRRSSSVGEARAGRGHSRMAAQGAAAM